jgi:hypothetical protein
MTSEAENGSAFGYELGQRDNQWIFQGPLLDALASAGPDATPHTVGGYLWGMIARDKDRWSVVMDRIAKHDILQMWLPEIARRTEVNDHLAGLILELAKKGRIPPERLGLMAFGGSTRTLRHESVEAWIEFLLSKNELDFASAAFEIFYGYYQRDGGWDRLPARLTWMLLTHPTPFRAESLMRRGTIIDHYGHEIAGHYINVEPDSGLSLASVLLNNFDSRAHLRHSGCDTQADS